MDKLKYPIGIQNFREIRIGKYVYVDKTPLIHHLISSGKYYFLSRPRRFGKSLLLSTLKEIYSGSQELFQGLWIADHWDWQKSNPVVHLRFAKSDYQELGLAQAIINELDKSAAELGIELSKATFKERFEELLLLTARTKGRVVLLIDEYDKPIIDYLDEPKKAQENRAILKQFYSILKDADPYIEFLIIAGVSKFSKVSVFSDLNNLSDISLHPAYATLLGITGEELEIYFSTRISNLTQQDSQIRSTIKEWYNGYSWDAKHWVYNPFSLLRFLESGVLQNYWFETGTPTFLVELIRQAGKFDLNEDAFVSLLSLASFEPASPNFMAILFQTGYLTFSEVNFPEGWCKLRYPNHEVKASLEQFFQAKNAKSQLLW